MDIRRQAELSVILQAITVLYNSCKTVLKSTRKTSWSNHLSAWRSSQIARASRGVAIHSQVSAGMHQALRVTLIIGTVWEANAVRITEAVHPQVRVMSRGLNISTSLQLR